MADLRTSLVLVLVQLLLMNVDKMIMRHQTNVVPRMLRRVVKRLLTRLLPLQSARHLKVKLGSRMLMAHLSSLVQMISLASRNIGG